MQGRVLSIQSHVCYGYVGNKCSVFPLQLLGFDVDPINSVQFSNHTGYPSFAGEVLHGEKLWRLVDGLDANGLLRGHTHLLTGYIGSASFLRTVIRVFHKLKASNPELRYVCDPVLGDEGKLYCPEENVQIFRAEVLPIATMVTPNQFEAELLSGIKMCTEADAREACAVLHRMGPETVVITSTSLGGENEIVLLASHRRGSSGSEGYDLYRVVFPRILQQFTGTGDLMAALILAWMHKLPGDFQAALENVAGTVNAVLKRTHAAGCTELRLIQSKGDIEHPPPLLKAVRIS